MKPEPFPFIVGVTGNIGSGKSTVANLWTRYNARIIEGDRLGRDVVEQSAEFRAWLKERFGDDVWSGDTLDRAALGRIVFSDEKARNDLDAAIWPYIRDLLQQEIDDALNAGLVAMVDAAMIFEWNDQDRYDVLVSVIVDPHRGAERAAARMGLTVEEMLQRYQMQIPALTKSKQSDFTIRNDGDLNELTAKAFGIWPHVAKRGREAARKRRNP
ncbi:dephospho-CoA kinase [bacterium]|nr:dephospho-CoA kinase [bacterium]